MNYSPIHNHSEYSALDGLSKCREIAERCIDIGCECCGITDHATVAGHLEFAQEMAKRDLKPIFGCELYHGVKTEFGKNERDQAHFVAGAMTDEGLRNLWRLVDAASTNFRYVGRVNWDMLSKHREGLFATSACISGLVPKGILNEEGGLGALNKYLEIFQDNFYIELHTYPGEEHELLNTTLVDIAREKGIPLIYATDAHFAGPEQYEIHDTYVAAQTGETIFKAPEERKMWHPKSLYIQDEAQIRASLSYLPSDAVDEALRNSGELAAKCNASLPEVKRHLPAFIPKRCPWTDKDESAPEMLVRLVEEGIKARYPDASKEVWDRAAQELEVFLDAGLEHYFLQAWDFCQFCDHNGIQRGPGRGSAAGAIVAYALKITDVDPLKYGLIFERFYNPGREKGFPDIDNDFPVKERKRVRDYLMKRWGEDKVRTIGTITRMKPKAAVDKLYKPLGLTWEDKEALKKIIDQVPDIDILGTDSIGWDKDIDPGKTVYVMDHVGEEIWEWAHTREGFGDFLEVLRVVCSRVANYGVHPSGVVVSDVSLDDELPCMWNSSQKVQVTCFPMVDVDKRMFVKQDLLGLRNLDTLMDWESQIGQTMDWSQIDGEDLPEEGWKLLDQGLTLGIFQIEKGYAKQLCKEFKPRSIEDLGIIVALNRPGPIRSGAPDSFIARRRGDEEVTYDHPILEPILEPTYGWFLYQEQVIAYFSALGYDIGDADAVRKILGKKSPEDMKALRDGTGEWEGKGYFQRAEEAGLDARSADIIWKKIEDFAKYSYNKSHAIAYATIAFRTLFAKYFGSQEFIIACIRTNSDDAGDYVGEGRRMGFQVLPPSIARSGIDVAVHGDGNVYFGLSNIKGIGKSAAEYICHLRGIYKPTCPEDLFEAVEAEQAMWEKRRDLAKEEGQPFKQKSPRQLLRANLIPLLHQTGAFDEFESRDISLVQRQKLEKDLLGVIISDDCDDIFARHAEALESCDSYVALERNEDTVFLPGIISQVTPKRTKKDNKAMGIITIEYQGEQAEFVVFPRQWTDYKFLWRERTPAIFGLSRGERGIKFERASKLS